MLSMPENEELDDLVAAQLSSAAYTPLAEWGLGRPRRSPELPGGWEVEPRLSIYGGNSNVIDRTVQMIAFKNAGTREFVFAFKGSDDGSNFKSDFHNSGGTAWESLKSNFEVVHDAAHSLNEYKDYRKFVTGHSLGGGMAQTAAVEYGLSGYTQNSLPISHTAIRNDTFPDGTFEAAHNIWRAKRHFLNASIVEHDIATGYYRDRGRQCYINTTTRVLPYLPGSRRSDGKDTSAAGPPGSLRTGFRTAKDSVADFVADHLPVHSVMGAIGAHSVGQVIQGVSWARSDDARAEGHARAEEHAQAEERDHALSAVLKKLRRMSDADACACVGTTTPGNLCRL
jgi:hypothetical protein